MMVSPSRKAIMSNFWINSASLSSIQQREDRVLSQERRQLLI